MDWSLLRLVFEAVTFGVGAGAWLYARHLARQAATQGEIKGLAQELADLRNVVLGDLNVRVVKVEGRLSDTPTAQAIHELALSINTFGGDLKAMGMRLEGLNEIVKRLEAVTSRQEEFLLQGGGR